MQNLISNLDTSMNTLVATLEEMKPAYIHAMKLMSATAQPISDQKNNLVFYGLPKEPLEIQMEKEPEFCRDILETRIKMIFREHLKISRDIPFITVYRFTTANPDPEEVKKCEKKIVIIILSVAISRIKCIVVPFSMVAKTRLEGYYY